MPKSIAGNWIEGLTLADKAEPRAEIMLFPFGKFKHPEYGEMVFDNKFFQDVIDNYESEILGQTKPFMDSEHDKGKALAWFTKPPFIRQGTGLFAKPEYTELGKKILGDKEYMYFSPWWLAEWEEPQTKRKHKNVWKGGGATNKPFLKVMPQIADDIKMSVDDEGMVRLPLNELTTESGSVDARTPGKGKSDENILKEAEMDKFAKILGLAEGATDADIEKKLSELVASLKDMEKKLEEAEKKPVEKPEEKPAEEKPKEGEPEPTEKEKEMATRLEATERKLTERDRDTDIGDALKGGKMYVKDRKFWEERYMEDPKGTKAALEHLHPVVNLKELGKDGITLEEESGKAGERLVSKARTLAVDKKMSFEDAYGRVCKENPELEKEYLEEFGMDDRGRK